MSSTNSLVILVSFLLDQIFSMGHPSEVDGSVAPTLPTTGNWLFAKCPALCERIFFEHSTNDQFADSV
jgi:hypothetical protein